jgi:transcriptional regulator with XRE-family HTH domain
MFIMLGARNFMYRSDLIKAKKAVKNLTVEDLANGADLSPTTVSKILAGEENIELGSLKRLAQYLEIPIPVLFSEKEPESVI